MSRLVDKALRIADPLAVPLVAPAAWLLKAVRKAGLEKLPLARKTLLRAGVLPVRDHYYEPQFDFRADGYDDGPRALPGIDWDVEGQLALLAELGWTEEVAAFPRGPAGPGRFTIENGAFGPGDAEVWYQLLRHRKPRRVVEVGSGFSTLVAQQALAKNAEEGCPCEHVCIEPYEMPWLESTGVQVVRERVERVGFERFEALEAGDVLFIDSSHVVRPHGDVLHLFLRVLPRLQPGVAVHVHDIFSPRPYPADWTTELLRLWNEQYVLEAFLTHNSAWRVLLGVNMLRADHYEAIHAVAPFLKPERGGGSFYIERLA